MFMATHGKSWVFLGLHPDLAERLRRESSRRPLNLERLLVDDATKFSTQPLHVDGDANRQWREARNLSGGEKR